MAVTERRYSVTGLAKGFAMFREISSEDERCELRKTMVERIAPGSEVEKAGVRGLERPRIRFGIKEQRAIGALFPKVHGRKHDRGRRKQRIGAWSGSGIDNWKSRISIAGRTGRISAAVISVPPFRCSRAPLTRGRVRVSLLKFLRPYSPPPSRGLRRQVISSASTETR